ncbi:MAG: hypothetical protein ACW981_04280 [Candidatus Hodarchaeales archaeon]
MSILGFGILGFLVGVLVLFFGFMGYISYTFDGIEFDIILLEPSASVEWIIWGIVIIFSSVFLFLFRYFYFIKYQAKKEKEKFLETYQKIYDYDFRQKH